MRSIAAGAALLMSAVAAATGAAAPSALAALGRELFFDTALSASGRLACASCHDPHHAYGPPDGRAVQPGGAALQSAGIRAVPCMTRLSQA